MKIERSARTLLGATTLCLLLMTAGCNGGNSAAGQPGASSSNVKAPVDWGMSLLGSGTVGIGQFPAKFTFDVNATPDCTNDYVAFNTGLTGAAGMVANIVAFNALYATQGSVGGLCNQDGPSVYWSYFTGTGTAVTSVVLSGDGTKVAFVENAGGGATLRILKWKAGEGTGAGSPAAVDQDISGSNWSMCIAGNSCVVSIPFNGSFQDTRSAPFYDYSADNLYVGDDSGHMHKFAGVFSGTPAEITATWPITVNDGAMLTSPVFDGVSGNIFVGDNTGLLSFIREVGSTAGTCGPAPCLDAAHLAVGTGGAVVDAPIVDGTTGMVFAVNGTETTNNGTILQASTALTGSVSFAIGGTETATGADHFIYSGAFDNAYFTSSIPNIAGHMYVCGKDPSEHDAPAVYQLSFAPTTGVLTGVGTPLTGLAQASGVACSPVTEFDNPNGAGAGVERDWIFFSIGDEALSGRSIPPGSPCYSDNTGCVISVDATGNPEWPPATVTNLASVPGNAAGSTSGFVVDNNSTSSQASSFYFSLGTNSTGPGPGLPSCNTTAGVGCAVKLTQSALN